MAEDLDVHVTLDTVLNLARAEAPIPAGDWPGAPVAALRALIDALEELAAEMDRPEFACCADAGIDCCSCLTGRHAECPECAQYEPPEDGD
jgi:hypothetical protein